MFGRTKAAIDKGRQLKETIQAAPANAQAAGARIAKATGRKLANGKAHCKEGGGSRGQHEPVFGRQQEKWTDPDTGHQYQLMLCRHCDGIMKVMPIGRKN